MMVTTLDMIYRGTRNMWSAIPPHKMADRLSSLEQRTSRTSIDIVTDMTTNVVFKMLQTHETHILEVFGLFLTCNKQM